MSDTEDIDAMRREVGARAVEGGQARTVVLSRAYDTTVEDLWDACTNPERIPRWFLPVSGELKVGGRYQLEGNAGGTVETCDPPNGFSATWEFGGGVSWIEVRFAPEPDGRARLELEHISRVGDEMWAQFGPGAVGIGWDLALARGLAAHVASGGAQVDPAEAEAWTASEDGRRFIAETSERWRAASVAAGTDPAEAAAAAERVIAAYTAPSEG